jgi:NAD(P)-dependent dehydrogenase (short-subunit alcohol dehydrogenase family)
VTGGGSGIGLATARQLAQTRRVHHPALPRLELGTRAGIGTQQLGECAQHCAQVAATDLTGNTHGLADAVAHRVGQIVLQRIKALAEPAAGAIAGTEPGERRPQRLGATQRQRRQALG